MSVLKHECVQVAAQKHCSHSPLFIIGVGVDVGVGVGVGVGVVALTETGHEW